MILNNYKRLGVDILSFVTFGLLALILFTNNDLFGDNPMDLVALIPLKLSMAVIHWHLFRKLYFRGKVDWKVKVKEINAHTLFSITSFVMFVYAYTSFS